MKFTHIAFGIFILVSTSQIFGQESWEKVQPINPPNNSIVIPRVYFSDLFKLKPSLSANEHKVQSFDFLKNYEFRFYKIARYYTYTSSLIPCDMAYNKPGFYHYLDQVYVVSKWRE